jgi:hypothetical protein
MTWHSRGQVSVAHLSEKKTADVQDDNLSTLR